MLIMNLNFINDLGTSNLSKSLSHYGNKDCRYIDLREYRENANEEEVSWVNQLVSEIAFLMDCKNVNINIDYNSEVLEELIKRHIETILFINHDFTPTNSLMLSLPSSIETKLRYIEENDEYFSIVEKAKDLVDIIDNGLGERESTKYKYVDVSFLDNGSIIQIIQDKETLEYRIELLDSDYNLISSKDCKNFFFK